MCRRQARFGRNRKTWPAQKLRRGSPHHKYAQPLLLDASICLFGSWTLALKGGTSQFGLGRHCAHALNVSAAGQIRSKSENLAGAKVASRFPTPQLRTTIAAGCFHLFVWVMDPGFEGEYITIWAGEPSHSRFECVGGRPESVKNAKTCLRRKSGVEVPHTTTAHNHCCWMLPSVCLGHGPWL